MRALCCVLCPSCSKNLLLWPPQLNKVEHDAPAPAHIHIVFGVQTANTQTHSAPFLHSTCGAGDCYTFQAYASAGLAIFVCVFVVVGQGRRLKRAHTTFNKRRASHVVREVHASCRRTGTGVSKDDDGVDERAHRKVMRPNRGTGLAVMQSARSDCDKGGKTHASVLALFTTVMPYSPRRAVYAGTGGNSGRIESPESPPAATTGVTRCAGIFRAGARDVRSRRGDTQRGYRQGTNCVCVYVYNILTRAHPNRTPNTSGSVIYPYTAAQQTCGVLKRERVRGSDFGAVDMQFCVNFK